MTKIELLLAYQKETGLGLETIKDITESPQVEIEVICQCPDCETEFSEDHSAHLAEDLAEYIQWLEDKTMRFLLIKDMNDTMNNLQIMYPWGQSDQTNQK